jgi:hypothetical protein
VYHNWNGGREQGVTDSLSERVGVGLETLTAMRKNVIMVCEGSQGYYDFMGCDCAGEYYDFMGYESAYEYYDL